VNSWRVYARDVRGSKFPTDSPLCTTVQSRGKKLLWWTYRNLPMLFRTVPFPTPYGLLFPEIGGSQLPPKKSLLSPEQVKIPTSYLPVHSQGPSEQKPIKNVGEKGASKFFGYPLLSQERVKLRTSNFVRTFTGSMEQKPIKKFGKSSRGHTQGL